MANTKYAKATGGTPIISWIPNQITAVLNFMSDVIDLIPNETLFLNRKELNNQLLKKRELLSNQLKLLTAKDYKVEEVFSLNKKMDLSDKN